MTTEGMVSKMVTLSMEVVDVDEMVVQDGKPTKGPVELAGAMR